MLYGGGQGRSGCYDPAVVLLGSICRQIWWYSTGQLKEMMAGAPKRSLMGHMILSFLMMLPAGPVFGNIMGTLWEHYGNIMVLC